MGGGVGLGAGQGGYERRSEVFVKIQKKMGGGGRVGGVGVRVDVNGEVKFFENSKKIFFVGGRVVGGSAGWM